MKVNRNDPCPCGSGKKYKLCCWEKDIKAGVKSTTRNTMWNNALVQIRSSPRGSEHWEYTNALIDDILKEKLKNSLILKYQPIGWLEPLYFSHFVLKSHYWFNVYNRFIAKDDVQCAFSNLTAIPLHTPLYIRIISLCLRIIIDRLGVSKYDKLPPIPPGLYIQPNYTLSSMVDSEGGIFEYIDRITDNATVEIKRFFDEVRNDRNDIDSNLSQNFLLPMPLYELPEYIALIQNCRDKFSKSLTFEDKITEYPVMTQNGEEVTFCEEYPAAIQFLRADQFKTQFLPELVNFVKKMYMRLASSKEKDQVQKLCEFYYFFFRNVPLQSLEHVYQKNFKIETFLSYEGISESMLYEHTYRAGENNYSLADPFKKELGLFEHSLDLFDKPFLQDRFGNIHFSILWLFDALISELTWLLRNYYISLKRSIRTENYISLLMHTNVNKFYPEAPKKGPFKLMLKNVNPRSKNPNYSLIVTNLSEYKFESYEVVVPLELMPNNHFVEFDVLFIFHDTLIVVEVKDDLFWDIRDLPEPIILYLRKQNDKLTNKIKYLNNPQIKELLKEKGILYKVVKPIVISQKNVDHPEIFGITGFFDMIHQIDYTARTGKTDEIISFKFLNYPKYPWKI